jgi:hypothetical protein
VYPVACMKSVLFVKPVSFVKSVSVQVRGLRCGARSMRTGLWSSGTSRPVH